MANKLGLDQAKIDRARKLAGQIADDVMGSIADKTTVAMERTVLRLFGLDGVNEEGIPLPNVLVDAVVKKGKLERGISAWVLNAMLQTGMGIQEIGELVAAGELELTQLPLASDKEIRDRGAKEAQRALDRVRQSREARNERLLSLGEGSKPYVYVIVATGNIYEDVIQAKAAARQGADIIAVIRTTGQSLLDYVPYGATTEGFGGTYATQANFRIMRAALDEVGEEVGRYIRLCNYASGLCMPEMAAMGAMERLDVMLNDALYGILFRDINMQRTLIDQHFSRMINAYAGIIINTGEDNYLTTADAVAAAHTVLASQLINEQLAKHSGLPDEQMGLGHAFEMNPAIEDGFLWEWAQAEMAREIFPNAPLKYMPPTKHMTGDIFLGHVQDALFNLIGVATGQGIQLLGMMTEAIHTPLLHDRQLAIESARYIFNNARHLQDEVQFKQDGRMVKRARQVLDEATETMAGIVQKGLFHALSEGVFADVKRTWEGGKGRHGVVQRAPEYYNPIEEELVRRLSLGTAKEAVVE